MSTDEEWPLEKAKDYIIESPYLVGRDPCYPDCEGHCECSYEKRKPSLVNFESYIRLIREAAKELIAEGYFEEVILYRPTQKAFDKQKELKD